MATSLVFSVRRHEPVLVLPSEPTPHEFKPLSDIDDQESLRFQVPMIQYYRNEPSMTGQDPATAIREALAKALVFYYPFAGRLREGPGRKLIVECTGEGVLFTEADANVRLEQFGDGLPPPVPCLEELLHDVPGSRGILGCPLLSIQVTRLICGGFIVALRFSHTMVDAFGIVQFLKAIGEIARVAPAPTVRPVWARDLLNARNPPRVTHAHREFDEVPAPISPTVPPNDDMVHRSFFFGSREISALRHHLPPHLRTCSTFEVLTASVWRSRTIALGLNPEEEVRFLFNVNARPRFDTLSPVGYYGNAFVYPVALSTAGELSQNPLGYALELVRRAKSSVTQDYIHSVADLMVLRGRPPFTMVSTRQTFFVSDVTRAGFCEVDFGWGKAVYGGIAVGGFEAKPGVLSFFSRLRNIKGEEGVVVPLCLPRFAMERFVVEVESMIGGTINEPHNNS